MSTPPPPPGPPGQNQPQWGQGDHPGQQAGQGEQSAQQWGQDGGGYSQYDQGQHQSPSNGMGIAALVLGILAIVTGFFFIGALFGVIAVVLGFIGRGKAKRGEATNGGVALAGIITGIVGILIPIVLVAIGAAIFNSDTFQNLTDCVVAAGEDQAAIERCAEDFQPGQ